jgi:hypothetical protein
VKSCFFLSLLLVCTAAQFVYAQTTTTTQNVSSTPLWVKDLRRAEIVAFGVFPFAMFVTTSVIDTYRFATHDWDQLYAPWPIKPAGAIVMTQDELTNTVTIAAGLSLVVSIVDYLIVQNKRHKQARRLDRVPGETPITTRRPWPETEQSVQDE